MSRSQLASGVEVVAVPGRGLAVRTADGEFLSVRTGDTDDGALLSLLSGRAPGEPEPDAELDRLVRAFDSAGYLAEAPPRAQWPAGRRDIRLLGDPLLTEPLAALLRASGAEPRTATPGDLARAHPASADNLADVSPAVSGGRADVDAALGASAGESPAVLDDLAGVNEVAVGDMADANPAVPGGWADADLALGVPAGESPAVLDDLAGVNDVAVGDLADASPAVSVGRADVDLALGASAGESPAVADDLAGVNEVAVDDPADGAPAAVVWCLDGPVPEGLWDAADLLPERGTAWLRCHREGWHVYLEPLAAAPGDVTSAHVRARRLAATPAHRELAAYWSGPRASGEPVQLTAPAAGLLAALLADDLTRWATDAPHTGGLPARRRLRCVDLRTLTVTEHPVLPVPDVAPMPGKTG